MNKNITLNLSLSLALLLLFAATYTHAAELTGRFSMLGSTSRATQGDVAYIDSDNTLTADQQSLRLMLDGAGDNHEWSMHLKMTRIHLSNIAFVDYHSSDLFRANKLSADWLNENEINNATRIGYEVDRAVYKHNFKSMTFALGRQAIDWGSGRLWQPLNVFGAFSPTDLDTDYKPGIDVARLDWFPTDYSSLTAVYAFPAKKNTLITKYKNSAVYYRKQVGKESEYALLAGKIIGYNITGASFESAWQGLGWRVEAAHYSDNKENKTFTFLIAGIDYQFNNGTLLSAEWYNNSRGANSVAELSNIQVDTLSQYGLQQHLSQNVLGLSLNKSISPLLNAGYTLLISSLKDEAEKAEQSLLQQINLVYSVSDESDLLFALQSATGSGLTTFGKIQSEFGHVPASLSIRLRFYF